MIKIVVQVIWCFNLATLETQKDDHGDGLKAAVFEPHCVFINSCVTSCPELLMDNTKTQQQKMLFHTDAAVHANYS